MVSQQEKPPFSTQLPVGWEIIREIPPINRGFKIHLEKFLEKGEVCVSGKVMLERAVMIGMPAGLAHLRHLWRYREDIPPFPDGYNVIFPGTLARDTIGYEAAASLRRCDGQELVHWLCIDCPFVTPLFDAKCLVAILE